LPRLPRLRASEFSSASDSKHGWAREERRRAVSFTLPASDPTATTSEAGSRFRRVAIEYPEIESRASSVYDALRQLVLDPGSFDVLLAEASSRRSPARRTRASVLLSLDLARETPTGFAGYCAVAFGAAAQSSKKAIK
jgi:hypothetical protein